MVKKFTIPFASQGDANDIPDALQVDGKVSFTQGFGYDYERPYDDPRAKDIAREDMNGLFKAITTAVGELQTLGASEWSNAISYPKGAIVYHEKDLFISQIDDNKNKPPQSWTSIKNIADDSLKKNMNLSDLTNKATARSNLGLGSSATLNKTDILGTSTSLVATQKLVNDTKINLESSKQDKLEFVGSGKVMREGAHGIGRDSIENCVETLNDLLQASSGFYFAGASSEIGKQLGDGVELINLPQNDNYGSVLAVTNAGKVFSTGKIEGEFLGWKEAFTKDLVSQSTGSSTASVMSQKAVTDQLNAIKSGHGLGYGQKWVDVKSQRAAGTTYTNNTGKPIEVTVSYSRQDDGSAIHEFTVDGVIVGRSATRHDVREKTSFTSAIVPPGSRYSISDISGTLLVWAELR